MNLGIIAVTKFFQALAGMAPIQFDPFRWWLFFVLVIDVSLFGFAWPVHVDVFARLRGWICARVVSVTMCAFCYSAPGHVVFVFWRLLPRFRWQFFSPTLTVVLWKSFGAAGWNDTVFSTVLLSLVCVCGWDLVEQYGSCTIHRNLLHVGLFIVFQ